MIATINLLITTITIIVTITTAFSSEETFPPLKNQSSILSLPNCDGHAKQLLTAIEEEDFEAAKALLEKGIEINCLDNDKKAPLGASINALLYYEKNHKKISEPALSIFQLIINNPHINLNIHSHIPYSESHYQIKSPLKALLEIEIEPQTTLALVAERLINAGADLEAALKEFTEQNIPNRSQELINSINSKYITQLKKQCEAADKYLCQDSSSASAEDLGNARVMPHELIGIVQGYILEEVASKKPHRSY